MSDALRAFLSASVGVVVLAIAIIGGRALIARRVRARSRPAQTEAVPERLTITLELVADRPDDPRVRRILEQTAARLFATLPALREIEARDARGRLLAIVPRPGVPAPPADIRTTAPHSGIGVTHTGDEEGEPIHGERFEASVPLARWVANTGRANEERLPLTELFDLPDEISARVPAGAGDPVALVRAIVTAAGKDVRGKDPVLRIGDDAVIVLRVPFGDPVTRAELNQAYLQFRRSGAHRGLVLTVGFMTPADVRRRELLEPALTHGGCDTIQRMADAVALGADPLKFARAPSVTIAPPA